MCHIIQGDMVDDVLSAILSRIIITLSVLLANVSKADDVMNDNPVHYISLTNPFTTYP